LQLTKKYFNGVVPACGELLDIDKEVFNELKGVKEKVETLLNNYKFRDAQREVMNIARIGNKYMTDCEPWKLWKTEPQRVETILYVCLQLVANLAIAFEPFLPFSSKKLRQLIHIENADWSKLGATDLLTQGHQLAEPELLFEKIEDETIAFQLEKLDNIKKANEQANYKAKPIKPVVSYEDFEKLDIRVGKVLTCEKVKKANKLLKFTLDDGSGKERTIVSGIAKFYEPEELVGKSVLFIANFEPRKLMGITSEGMILSAVDFDESLSVTTTLREVKPGSQVG
jgi:methionine--tRNA ligase, beta subunit